MSSKARGSPSNLEVARMEKSVSLAASEATLLVEISAACRTAGKWETEQNSGK